MSPESITTIPFQARASDVKIPEWGQHCSNLRMAYLSSIFVTFRRTGDQPNKNPGALSRCMADILLNITDHEMQQPGMLVAQRIGHVGLVGCTNDSHNHRSSRKLLLRFPPPIAWVHLTIYSATFRGSKAHRFKIEVHLKCEMCQKELYTFENIPVILCSEDVRMIFDLTIIAKPKMESAEQLVKSIC